jgi:2-succinyl-5-enolpyruvyl-6-hydroxy-3-cyclohexene-1-carboxylate synthase
MANWEEYTISGDNSSKKMVLVWRCEADPNTIRNGTNGTLAADPSVVVLQKPLPICQSSLSIKYRSIIAPFTADDFENFQPEITITLAE